MKWFSADVVAAPKISPYGAEAAVGRNLAVSAMAALPPIEGY
jgi:hypothetical protein